ncbi:hypothetical protein NSND_50209 [Nitrospira sp. ND1]|nr:hypothetical protein NSND_50209 [Nitrospira sp. ND1]
MQPQLHPLPDFYRQRAISLAKILLSSSDTELISRPTLHQVKLNGLNSPRTLTSPQCLHGTIQLPASRFTFGLKPTGFARRLSQRRIGRRQ